ncbi:hypothetical protein G3I40_28300 [Streptomyces sp. SID14478]|uniref:hypothetical protein n=1 Tax=Streptomyces sp. SID14478 TaxID=2706073 RepID=UPI0013DBBEB4|nr:hypothetical protein [Streptomyces sp. SID14478]NEB79091.1 hypothetical protein [Streptomyces sp. SID14478]
MSIWLRLPGPDILALDGADDAANYHAAGEPVINIDVATNGFHDHIRLALFDGGADAEALLSPAAARLLRDRLTAALGDEPTA